jgi:dTDP-4-amino-4,6-dideoxygalactose transaminase
MFDIINKFENKIAKFFGSKFAVSTDCCTHAIEMCLIYNKIQNISIPNRTYLSVPMTAKKLNIRWQWQDNPWEHYYKLSDNIYDAAVLWKQNSYIPNTFMCLSFQFKKHLSLGRGGMILTDNESAYHDLIKLSYDGRSRDLPWAEQDIDSFGYHYYMTPETAQLGLDKLDTAINTIPKTWSWQDYPDLRNMSIFVQ